MSEGHFTTKPRPLPALCLEVKVMSSKHSSVLLWKMTDVFVFSCMFNDSKGKKAKISRDWCTLKTWKSFVIAVCLFVWMFVCLCLCVHRGRWYLFLHCTIICHFYDAVSHLHKLSFLVYFCCYKSFNNLLFAAFKGTVHSKLISSSSHKFMMTEFIFIWAVRLKPTF